MAMNWPQLVKPRACRSALCCLTACSNPPRENSFNICEKMLHTFIRLSLLYLSWFLGEPNPAYQGAQSFSHVAIPSARSAVSPRIWTAMKVVIDSQRAGIERIPTWQLRLVAGNPAGRAVDWR